MKRRSSDPVPEPTRQVPEIHYHGEGKGDAIGLHQELDFDEGETRQERLRAWFAANWGRRARDKDNGDDWKPWRYRGLPSRLKRTGRQKIYRFKGYTTAARVDRKRRRERLRHARNQLIITAIIVTILILVYLWLDPLPKIADLRRVLGF
ncbi:MAG: hypothetical protein QM296_05270 [Bacillota bacterium]|nr:hypothetical protein [Bacillota bacterium]